LTPPSAKHEEAKHKHEHEHWCSRHTQDHQPFFLDP
jgi:hypothetical protein